MGQYGVTEKGFVMKRLDTIINEVQTDLSAALGFDVSQNPQSLLNAALIIPFCDKIAELWEVSQDSYYAKYPSTAEGVNLDNACQYGNVFRKGNKHTDYIIHCTAKDSTVIPAGSLIKSITNPAVQLKCVQDSKVCRESCNAICIKPVIAAAGTYTIELDGSLYSYEAGENDDLACIVDNLAAAFKADGYTVSVDRGKTEITITDTVESRSNAFSLTSNLTTVYVTSCIHYYTEDYGDIRCPNGSITELVSNVTGLISVVNKIEPTPGRVQQSDISLRQDYVRKTYSTSTAQTHSVEAYVLESVEGVKDVRCYENQFNVEDALGRPPHCIEVIVDGGKPEKITEAILAKKSGGIYTYGDITVETLGEYGDIIPVSFRRPEPVYAWVNIELKKTGSVNINPDYVSIVKETVCRAAQYLSIGDNFMTQTYISGIYGALAGLAYCRIRVAGTQDPGKPPDEYFDGNIYATQRQVIIVDAARIEVRLTE